MSGSMVSLVSSRHAQIEEQAPLEVDANTTRDDYDSAYGDDLGSYTTSLHSSITNYRYENGRRYHAYRAGAYHFPNDELENQRMEIMHHMMTLRLQGELHLAPICPNPKYILDLGTGTGAWAIDIGEAYPSAEVIGVDLSPIQPGMAPPNVRFEVDDIESSWTFEHQFDYIHCRNMSCAIRDWPGLVKQAFSFLKQGGWVEFQDVDPLFYSNDGSLTEKHDLRKWCVQMCDTFSTLGREPNPGPFLREWIEDAGFMNISHKTLKLPIGTWPREPRFKEIGTFNLVQLLQGFEGFSLAAFTRHLGWSKDEVEMFVNNVKRDCINPKIHSLYDFHLVCGQKPDEETALVREANL